jgi:hypothetical protein
MNKAQWIAIAVPLIVGATSATVEKFGITPADWQKDVGDILGVVFGVGAMMYSHYFHKNTTTTDNTTGVVKSQTK